MIPSVLTYLCAPSITSQYRAYVVVEERCRACARQSFCFSFFNLPPFLPSCFLVFLRSPFRPLSTFLLSSVPVLLSSLSLSSGFLLLLLSSALLLEHWVNPSLHLRAFRLHSCLQTFTHSWYFQTSQLLSNVVCVWNKFSKLWNIVK